jgi:hypothetical protein
MKGCISREVLDFIQQWVYLCTLWKQESLYLSAESRISLVATHEMQHRPSKFHHTLTLEIGRRRPRLHHQVMIFSLNTQPPPKTFCLHFAFALRLCSSNSTHSPQALACSGMSPFASIPSSSIPISHSPTLPAKIESYMHSLRWTARRRLIA